MANHFAEALGSHDPSSLNASTSFFELGGDSLSALHLLSLLRDEMGFIVSIPTLFSHPSIQGLAKLYANNRRNVAKPSTMVRVRLCRVL